MKSVFTCIILSICLQTSDPPIQKKQNSPSIPPVQNLVIITIDGFRWQEVFTGADSMLINDERVSPDASTMKMLYWASTPDERRKKLMPFFWNVMAAKGQVYGNRHFDNKVNVSNIYSLSYPGYNEIFTGEADLTISSNGKRNNHNSNVLQYLNEQPSFKGSVVAFTSWDVFPYILNEESNGFKINSGYEKIDENMDDHQYMINRVQDESIYDKTETRYDQLTFITAKEYMRKHTPKIVYLGFGETDEMAHQARYDLYLEKASQIDKMIAELWHWVQSTEGYKDNTTFIITTDHGRGSKRSKWNGHGSFIKGSSQTWLAVIGPNIKPFGEMKNEDQIYEKQIAQTIANLVGENFESRQTIAPAITLR